MEVWDWVFQVTLGCLCLLFHQAYQPVQMAPFFLLTQGFPLIHSHQEFQGHLACLKSLLVQQTPSHPLDPAGLATQRLLASLSSPGSQLALEIQEGLSGQADLPFQVVQGDLSLLLDLSFQDVLKCLESLVLLGVRVCP